ncbi:MAG: hypothetical protein XD81_1580 [Bacteroidetes bacterium 38_7]|jgi:hypothetical protein|nr:MAG: hypothetical protein XD81_1580 [Bacteroidetes bacterium 38_7]HBH11798.1 hypothetical protein [Clostridiales bacterium]
MRAKEYLEANKQKICHYDLVKKVIYDLSPLRNNKQKTEEYCNRTLFPDLQGHLTSNSTGSLPATEMKPERAIDSSIANQIRYSILKVINRDNTFLFAHNFIVSKAKIFDNLLMLIDYKLRDENDTSVQQIEQECQKYRDDYPKTNLSKLAESHCSLLTLTQVSISPFIFVKFNYSIFVLDYECFCVFEIHNLKVRYHGEVNIQLITERDLY